MASTLRLLFPRSINKMTTAVIHNRATPPTTPPTIAPTFGPGFGIIVADGVVEEVVIGRNVVVDEEVVDGELDDVLDRGGPWKPVNIGRPSGAVVSPADVK